MNVSTVLIGKSIDQYHILEQLGQGGMATVYRAYDTRLERDVAIKIIRTDEIPPSQLEMLLKRFEREVKSQARFSHPNIVPVFDFGEYEGMPYLVMEYLQVGTLRDKMHGTLPLGTAVAVLAPIASALAYAHGLGVIHRDVKPSNILFNQQRRPMLTDFGIAKLLESNQSTLTGTGLGVGTPEYMAPEQWKGTSVPQTDIYALGVVLYEMLTGVRPYTAETPLAVALKQMSEPIRRPSDVVADIPEEVELVLFKALAKQPENRYENMTAMMQAMQKLAQGVHREKVQFPASIPVSSQKEDATSELIREEETSASDLFEMVDEMPHVPETRIKPAMQSVLPARPVVAPQSVVKPVSKSKLEKGEFGWWIWAGLGGVALLVLVIGASSGWFNAEAIPTQELIAVN